MTNNLLAAAAFIPDLFEAETAWLGHLRFAHFLMREHRPKIFVELGTHYGHSYFAFCKSVLEADIDTKCFAVDTWQGDEHAGIYGEEIYARVRHENETKYSKFSSLLRMTFDEAATHFLDGTVDLLHIDGLHTYEAVKKDFQTWLPKLSSNAIVMFHDSKVKEKDFGVWRLWEDLAKYYPNNIEFFHSYGLAVLQLNDPLKSEMLDWLRPESNQKNDIVNYFSALANYDEERRKTKHLVLALANRDTEIANRDTEIASLNNELYKIHNSFGWRLVSLVRSIFQGKAIK